ncbi:pPIWI_RE module domain-containing protein [Nostoc sp. DedSLP04]|uniref:pPIWI_RE module domain-containing protein n=1 Tax=Nostoc sp. DedSLP04 TaxID=3075401 RepID=UPI002AD59C7D|nr:DUF3962 domain-containing protein [Nostoc sp. DedSLP04]MDZ8036038.1 DUF3962 domain-containing protein [Nostoc sp. DedSLP04]
MAYNSIQLFALQIPTKISLTFDLYALAVPKKWKDLFSRLQKYKHDKNYVLPPIECLNQALTISIDDEILFPSPNAFRLTSNTHWFYSKSNNISKEYIVNVVKNWLNVSFKDLDCLTTSDIQEIHSLSAHDLEFQQVKIPETVWSIEGGELKTDPLYYSLIPYLIASAIVAEPLSLIDTNSNQVFETLQFHECVVEKSNVQEIISWPPTIITQDKKKKGSEEKEKPTHYYSFLLRFAFHYNLNGEPYLTCDYGIRRWVSWELGYLSTGKTVYISPTNSKRFAPCKLKYMGKQRGIDFEGNLVNLLKSLNFKDKFNAQDVVQTPYKNNDLAWGVVYGNTISRSHNAEDGLFPKDNAIFHKACLERIQNVLGEEFCFIELYSRCDNDKLLKKPRSEYNQVKEFIKKHFASINTSPPFYIPPNLKLVLLSQSKEAEELIRPLAKKYGIDDVNIHSLGVLGAEMSGKNWRTDCANRIKEFQKLLPPSPQNQKTLTLIEILPKKHFWKDARKDPKPCFRPALAMLGSVTDHFEPKDENDKGDFLTEAEFNDEITKLEVAQAAAKEQGKFVKKKSLKSNFSHRIESSLKSGLSMAGAYFYPTFEVENFPTDVASVGVYKIPFYTGEITKYFPVAVRMDKSGVTAKAYGCDEWLDFYLFQIKMASGAFESIEFNKKKVQNWVFNNLFQETKQPTIYCFDADNLRSHGLLFLQKKLWRKHFLAFDTSENPKNEDITFISTSKYPHIRIANIIAPNTTEVPIYRACDEDGNLEGHTTGVFHPSSKGSECGYYYLSNQRPESRSGGILQESKLVPLAITKNDKTGKPKKPKPQAQGYNPRGVILSLTLQEADCFSDWATFVQCQRLYGMIQYLDATIFPEVLHRAVGLDAYRPIQAIREP